MVKNRNKLCRSALVAASLLLLIVLLSGCGRGDNIAPYPIQTWGEDVTIEVQVRPTVISEGMVEILIIANRPPRRPAHDLLVFISIDEDGAWQQAIQDGHMGVYRRAVLITDPENNVLNVRIRHDEHEETLQFPLRQEIIDG